MNQQPVMADAGPWVYTDPEGHTYIVDVVPLEHDPTLDDAHQPRALYFQSENGWISATPVGPGFSLDNLTEEDLFRLFVFITDQGRLVHWKLVHWNRGLFIDSDRRMYRVRIAPGRTVGSALEVRRNALIFESLDGEWRGFAPIDHPVTLESLSTRDVLGLLRRAIGWA